MPDPAIVTCTKGQWTIVATAVTTGQVNRIEKRPVYYQTYRPTGEAAPDPVTDKLEKIPIFLGNDQEAIEASEQIDVYIFVSGTVDGKVRVDV